jgi:hypothetical protein
MRQLEEDVVSAVKEENKHKIYAKYLRRAVVRMLYTA